MSNKQDIFKYRHKKFDQGKRSREKDSFSSESGTNSSSNDCCDLSAPSISSKVISNPHKLRRVSNPIQESNLESAESDFLQRVQLIDLRDKELHCPRPITIQPKEIIFPINATVLTANNKVMIKTEIIEPTEIPSECPSPKRRKIQSKSKSMKIETQSSPDHIKIKEELVELNTHLPAIPRKAYEDICKFRSNMVRKFPKKDRSAKEQERRDKNTFACRKSRRVKKIEQVAVEEEYKGYKDANLRMAEYAIRAAAYFKELMKITEAENAASEIIVVD